jgi:hypothetical protein
VRCYDAHLQVTGQTGTLGIWDKPDGDAFMAHTRDQTIGGPAHQLWEVILEVMNWFPVQISLRFVRAGEKVHRPKGEAFALGNLKVLDIVVNDVCLFIESISYVSCDSIEGDCAIRASIVMLSDGFPVSSGGCHHPRDVLHMADARELDP